LALTLVALMAGCGSRVSAADLLAAEGGSTVTVTLPPDVVAALKRNAESTPTAPSARPAHPLSRSAGTIPAAADPRRPRTPPRDKRAAPSAEAPVAGKTDASSGPPCNDPATPVPIGQVGTFSGVVGAITAAARTAVAAWARDVNARGGLACHPVQLFVKDDGSDPARAAAAVQELVTNNHVLALVGDIVPFSVAGFRPAVEKAQVPAVGGDTIAPEWHESPWMYSQGPSTDDQLVLGVKAGVQTGHRRVGLVYCVEVATCAYADKFLREGGAKAGGGDFVYDAPVSITQTDYTAQCLNARNAGVELLIMGMDGASMTRLARSCDAIHYRPLLLTGAGTFSLKNTEDPTLRLLGMVTGSPVAPWVADDVPGLREFHAAMTRYAPDLAPDGEAVIGWSSGKLLEAAVAHLSAQERAAPLTSAAIVVGLQRLRDETLGGLAAGLTFAPDPAHAKSRPCSYVLRLTTAGWTAPHGSHPICR
jgi:branched-chain amino acid transport system substrate-binding protein